MRLREPNCPRSHGLIATMRQSRGERQPLVGKRQEDTSRGRRAGSRELALTVCQVLGWHLANVISLYVYETKGDHVWAGSGNREGTRPREQTFVSPRCHQQ